MQRWLWCVFICLTVGCNSTPDDPPPELEPTPAPAPSVTPTVELEQLGKTDPIAFLERCRDKTAREIKATRGTLLMRERIKGKVSPQQRIHFSFREQPYCVRMDWKEGVNLARKTCYVAGQNDGHLLVQPAGWRSLAGIVLRKPDSEDAMSSSRIPITEFGMQKGIESTIGVWKAARERGGLRVAFSGPKTIPQLGDLPVWELRRTGYEAPEFDGILRATYYVDPRTCLQVGVHLLGKDDELIGAYYFRDLEINPTFDKDTFTREGLKK
jgi:Protein of unknown function (DUF1571)